MKTLAVLALTALVLTLTSCATNRSTSFYGKKGSKNYKNAMAHGKSEFWKNNAGKCNRYH